MKRKLKDIALILRSKNAGPFIITLDIIFPSRRCLEEVLKQLDGKVIAEAYNISPDRILSIVSYPIVNAIKVNILRSVSAGSPGDRDVYGSQQHIPLAEIEVNVSDECGVNT